MWWSDTVRSRRTEKSKPCPSCGKTLWWWEHAPDAVNPIGLWHHETEADDDACSEAR
jgi:hypothetical protein